MADKYGIFRTIPAWDVTDEKFFKDTVIATLDEFVKESVDYQYHIREIEEMDLSLNDWRLPANTGSSWTGTPWIQHALTIHETLCIYGVVSLSEYLTARKLIFGRGPHMSMIIARQDLTALRSFNIALEAIRNCKDKEWLQETFGKTEDLRMEGYFQEPIFYRPQDFVSIGVIPLSGFEPGELKLMGFVAEAVGKSIA